MVAYTDDRLRPLGDYNALENYFPNDLVKHGGKRWLALAPSLGTEPGTDQTKWEEFAGDGSGGGSVAWADVTGKPATFTPSAHGHDFSELSGTASAAQIPTASTSVKGGVQFAANGSATAGRAVEATDSRLSNARTPTAHAHAISDTTGLQTALDAKIAATEKGAANGVAPLGADSKVPIENLPDAVRTGDGSGINAEEIQGVPVSETAPVTGQALIYNGTEYVPTVPAGGGDVTGPNSSDSQSLALFSGTNGDAIASADISSPDTQTLVFPEKGEFEAVPLPASEHWLLFARPDGFRQRNPSGVETKLGGGGGNSTAIIDTSALSSPYVLSSNEANANTIILSGTRASTLQVVSPSARGFRLLNKCGQTVEFLPAVGAPVWAAVPHNEAAQVITDLSDVWVASLRKQAFGPSIFPSLIFWADGGYPATGAWVDRGTLGKDGVIYGATWDEVNSMLSFDGDDYVDFGSSWDTNFGTSYTIALRARTATVSDNRVFAAMRSGGQSIKFQIDQDGDDLRLLVRDSGGTVVAATAANVLSINTTFSVHAVRDGNNLTLYKDGIQVATATGTIGTTYNTEPLYAGGFSSGASSARLNGKIRHLYAYNRALTSTEIAQLVAAGY
jgi:hypothetical protein